MERELSEERQVREPARVVPDSYFAFLVSVFAITRLTRRLLLG